MKCLLTTLVIFVTLFSFAQQKRDTIYMNEYWEVTKIIDSAKYYRIIKEADGLYFVRDYYIETDTLQMTGAFKDYAQKIKEGEFVYYSEKGLVTIRSNHKNGKFHGLYSTFYDTGEPRYTINYENNYYHGDFIVYYKDGKLRRKETYSYDKLKSKACYLPNGKKTKYFPYAVPATAKGGMNAVKKYLIENTYYPQVAVDQDIEGKVYVKFIISTTGEIKDVTVRKSSGHTILDEEAIRVIKVMPKWSPAQLDGELVESTFSLPVSFKLN